MITAPDIKSLLDDHWLAFEASLARHEQRLAALDTDLAQRIDACLARLDLELDALAERAGRSR